MDRVWTARVRRVLSGIGAMSLAMFCLMTAPPAVRADSPSHRVGHIEAFLGGGYHSDETTTNGSDSITFENNWSANGGIGFDFGPYVNLNIEAFGGPQTLSTSSFFGSDSTNDGYLVGAFANLELYPINGPLTPVLAGGVGGTRVHGDLAFSSLDETDFAFNGGAGVRWDIDEHWFIKGMYRAIFIDVRHADDLTVLHSGWFTIGVKF